MLDSEQLRTLTQLNLTTPQDSRPAVSHVRPTAFEESSAHVSAIKTRQYEFRSAFRVGT